MGALLQIWREKCNSDFDFFSEEILGFTNADHQREWCDTLGNFSYRKLVVAAPRGHSKTTVFSINYPLWRIAQDPNVRILLVSNADTQSQSFLREIKGRIERDQMYVDFAGQLKPQNPEKWNDKEIILKRSRTDLKDPTISTVSVEGTILSKRADEIICDDLLNFENTRTPEQRQKIHDWMALVLLPVLEPGGRLIVAGTIWQVDDLMEELLKDPTFDYRKKYKAIIKEPDHPELWQEWCDFLNEERDDRKIRAQIFRDEHREEMDEGIEVLWPARRSYEDLYMIRYSDPFAFARAYQNDPASRPNQKIKEAWISEALQKGASLKLQDLPHSEYVDISTMGLDLAISQAKTADDTCLLTLDMLRFDWGEFKAGTFIVRQIKRGKFTPKETRDLVTVDYYTQQPTGIRVETVAYQEAMQRDLEDRHIPIRGHRTGSEKHDSEVGVNSIAILLEQGKLILPSDPHDARTRDLVGKLAFEMRSWPEEHTGDSLMALWFAYLEMRDILGSRYIIPAPATPIEKAAIPAPVTPEQLQQENQKADLEAVKMGDQQRSYWSPQMIAAAESSRKRAQEESERLARMMN
jgi:hypothetical protein